MLQLVVSVKVSTTHGNAISRPQLVFERPPERLFERAPERHAGSGRLSMMGTRHVSFDVIYDIVLTRATGAPGRSRSPTLQGAIRRILRRNGRNLPEGVYGLNTLPGYRLAHFGGTWRLHAS